jgi:hypothetical protein
MTGISGGSSSTSGTNQASEVAIVLKIRKKAYDLATVCS